MPETDATGTRISKKAKSIWIPNDRKQEGKCAKKCAIDLLIAPMNNSPGSWIGHILSFDFVILWVRFRQQRAPSSWNTKQVWREPLEGRDGTATAGKMCPYNALGATNRGIASRKKFHRTRKHGFQKNMRLTIPRTRKFNLVPLGMPTSQFGKLNFFLMWTKTIILCWCFF